MEVDKGAEVSTGRRSGGFAIVTELFCEDLAHEVANCHYGEGEGNPPESPAVERPVALETEKSDKNC